MIAAAALVAALVVRASAQTSNVHCTYAEWTTNKKGETACTVWAQLQNICSPGATVGPITNVTAPYPSPSGATATPCNCNYIAYNLMAGCSWCQPGIYSSDWVDEAAWKLGCTTYSADSIPASIAPQVAALTLPPFVFLTDDGDAWSSFEASVANNELAGVTAPTGSGSGPTSGGGGGGGGLSPSGIGGGGSSIGHASATRSSFPEITGPFSGDDPLDETTASALGVGGIPVLGLAFGSPLLGYVVVLIVYFVRQSRRKAFYGPLAAYYQAGGAPPPSAMTGGVGSQFVAPAGGYAQPEQQPLFAGQQQPHSPAMYPQQTFTPTPSTAPYGTPPPPQGQAPGYSQFGAQQAPNPYGGYVGATPSPPPPNHYTTLAAPGGHGQGYHV